MSPISLRIGPAALPFLLPLLLPFVPAASAAPAKQPAVDKLTITGIEYSGTGCPAGSVAYTWTGDSSLFELSYSAYVATLGPGIPESESRKVCNIVVDVEVPDGYEPWVPAVEYYGYAQLDPGVVAHRAAAYKLTGDPPDPPFRDLVLDGEYHFTDHLDEPQCRPGRNPPVKKFRLRTHARLANRGKAAGATGILTVDLAAGSVAAEKWQLALHRCN